MSPVWLGASRSRETVTAMQTRRRGLESAPLLFLITMAFITRVN
jgi:hypothetical protein